ncbi:MAG: MSHA biogenesis protein MshG [Phenylobacterium sp.]|jgi:MSHA biogenesis protein MshG
MPFYDYKARDPQGALLEGQLEAPNEAGVADMLMRRKSIPVEIKLAKAKAGEKFDLQALFAAKVSIDDLLIFSRQMYALTRAGIPMIRALMGLAENTHSLVLKKALFDVASQLERGRTLSAALNSHPNVFNKLLASIIHVGENTGKLDEAFIQITDYFEKEQETRKQIKQATRYPVMVMGAITIAMFVLNIKVIPVFAGMFEKLGADLPWTTKALLASSNFFVDYWVHLVVAMAGGVFMLKRYLKTKKGLYQWDRYQLKMPMIGNILERALLGRFARSFSMMLRSGVPLTSALTLVADAVDNSYMADKVLGMRQTIERGESLLRSSTRSEMFTPLVLQMIAVGEETGQVEDLLNEVANYYEREVDFDLKNLTAKIEPILIAVVAGMVLILALGIFTPMWDMMGAMK